MDKNFKRVLLMCVLGTSLEWYDFALFGTLSYFIAKTFFPSRDPQIALLYTFGIFAAGFLVRPIGGIWIGHIGDKLGRKKALLLSIALMTLPTIAIGLLPGYASIGTLAPILLIACRLTQGFSVGGEYSGIITYLTEIIADKKRLHYYASFSVFGVVGGLFLGSVIGSFVCSIFKHHAWSTLAWRIPFIFSIFLGLITLHLRSKLSETKSFLALAKKKQLAKLPIVQVLKQDKYNVWLSAALFWPVMTATYIAFVFMPTRFIQAGLFSAQTALISTTTNMLVLTVCIPLCGFLSDKIAPIKVITFGLLGFMIVPPLLFDAMSMQSATFIILCQSTLSIITAITVAALPAYLSARFQTNTKYTGLSIGINLTAALFGGTAPLVANYLSDLCQSQILVGIYLSASAIIAYLTMRLSSHHSRFSAD